MTKNIRNEFKEVFTRLAEIFKAPSQSKISKTGFRTGEYWAVAVASGDWIGQPGHRKNPAKNLICVFRRHNNIPSKNEQLPVLSNPSVYETPE